MQHHHGRSSSDVYSCCLPHAQRALHGGAGGAPWQDVMERLPYDPGANGSGAQRDRQTSSSSGKHGCLNHAWPEVATRRSSSLCRLPCRKPQKASTAQINGNKHEDEDNTHLSSLHRCLFSCPWLAPGDDPISRGNKEEAAAANQRSEESGPFSSLSPFPKKWSRLVFSIRRENVSFRETAVLIRCFFVIAKHIKVFNTAVILETEVFLQYFENTSLPNIA